MKQPVEDVSAHPKAFYLDYYHYTKYTPGALDRFPFSEGVQRTLKVIMYRVPPDYRISNDTESFLVCDAADNQPIAGDDTKEDAENMARWYLMDRSRKAAEQEAQCPVS